MYWFKAGKGPDPRLAKLDADMADYWAKKKEADEAKEAAAASDAKEAEAETKDA